MREELPKNVDVVDEQQADKLLREHKNARRGVVSRKWVLAWYLLALISLFLWLMQLLGYISIV